MTLDYLMKISPDINWILNLNELTNIKIDYLIVDNPKFFKTLSNMFKKIPLDDWKIFSIYKIVKSSALYISERFVDHNFSFYQKELLDREKKSESWERILGVCNNCFGELIGKLYVNKFFPPSAKKKC